MATASVTNSFTNGTTADADDVNTNFGDLVTFLNNSVVHRDGTKAMTAALPLGSNKITGLASGTAATDAATFLQADHLLVTFTQAGELATGTGASKFPLPFDCDIIGVYGALGTAVEVTSDDLEVDVNVDGTTIFTTQSNRLIFEDTDTYSSTTTIEDASHDAAQLISVDIDSVGDDAPGEDLTVTIHLRRR